MARNWAYLTNPFIASTEGSYRAMKKISDFTYSAIKNQLPPPAIMAKGAPLTTLTVDDVAFFSELRNELEPLVIEFNAQYTAWHAAYADRKSQTSLLTDLLNQLRTEKIKEWDVTIQTVYSVNTPGYKRLLPRRRGPFQNGTQTTRIDALDLLVHQISTDTNFDEDFIQDIANFYNALKAAYDKQLAEKSDTSLASHDLEPARLALAEGLYGSLGAMMKYYKTQPDKIASFFDLEAIRNSEQSSYRHKVKPQETVNALVHTFHEDEMVRLVNDGVVPLVFWLAANVKKPAGETTVIVDKYTEKIILASELGDLANRFLMIKNPDEEIEGHYVVTLM